MQSWPGYSSSLDFVTDEYCALQSPSLSCSDHTSSSSAGAVEAAVPAATKQSKCRRHAWHYNSGIPALVTCLPRRPAHEEFRGSLGEGRLVA